MGSYGEREGGGVDRRWFLVAGLGVVSVGIIVALVVLMSKEPESGEEMVLFEGSLVGEWGCKDRTDMDFDDGGRFAWKNDIDDTSYAGTYEQEGSLLSMMTRAYLDEGEIVAVPEEELASGDMYQYELFQLGGMVFFFDEEGDMTYRCYRKEE